MGSILSAITLIIVAAHVLLLVYALLRGRRLRSGLLWLGTAIASAAVATAAYLTNDNTTVFNVLARGLMLALALVSLMTSFGMHAIGDLSRRKPRRSTRRTWVLLSLIWLVVIGYALYVNPAVPVGQAGWLAGMFSAPDLLSAALLIGLSVTGIFLLGFAFFTFYEALLPEVANRALFWVLNTAVLLIGTMVILSGTPPLVVVGSIALQLSMVGTTYAHLSYRVFDVRGTLGLMLRVLLLATFTTLVMFGGIGLARALVVDNPAETFLTLVVLALALAVGYMASRTLLEWLLDRLIGRKEADPAQATRRFSQQVSKAVELDQLANIAADTLAKEMRVRRAGLLLINDTAEDLVQLRVMPTGNLAEMRDARLHLSKVGKVYTELANKHNPLLQFDLEFSPTFMGEGEVERQFFAGLQMSAYAPIVMENALIGILAAGPKLNDTAFNRDDLALLMAMAHQTGVALRNARLVADLRHLNSSMRALNKVLEDANDQMEKLDSVKTDFITIASHELRTPLAQIRGYTDIIDALNEQGMLNQDQVTGLIVNLRKATERMEELIAAMLDVSQLDVNAMDLRFAQTTIEAVMRLAIDPLTDAIKQRKLTLSARGLRGLPPIHADMQRLVQAFRNIIVNAIKFTPDGGRIDIHAELQPAATGSDVDHLLVSIKDTGVGIAKENLELVFRKFFRAYDPGLHSTGTYKFMGAGPGLGLTIAKGVIEGHGGKVWAESAGHDMQTTPGSTFFVLLPVSPPEDARRVLPFEEQNAAQAAQPTG